MRRLPRRRRGFVTIIALFMVGLVAAALVTLAAAGASDARRTRSAAVTAQLRQLLLAGGADAAAHAAAWPPVVPAASWATPLPADLTAQTYTVTSDVRPDGDAAVDVTVTAAGQGRRAVQHLRWNRRNGSWRLVGVRLGESNTGR